MDVRATMSKLSIIIPARNEIFLKQTIEDILANMRGDTEIISVLDGYWPFPPIEDNERVTLVHLGKSIGQRAAQNLGVTISKSKYVMKVDAHCSFSEGFDQVLMDDMEDDWTVTPLMKNLHAFDWVCDQGHRRYQGPEGECKECGGATEMEVVWRAKPSPQSHAYRMNSELRFKYWGEYKKKQKGDLVETMGLPGSCFMSTREMYWEKELCDESWGSWGQQGSEVALKTWLSGGKVIVNKKCWYAHMFRTQPGFNWPYDNPGSDQEKARKICRDVFMNDKWPKAKHKLQWLIDKFEPPEWEVTPKQEAPSRGMLYYTSHTCPMRIARKVQKNLRKISEDKGIPLYSSSLKPMPHMGVKNIIQPLEHSEFQQVNGELKEVQVPRTQPGLKTMTQQILDGLKIMKEDIVYLCEHDVLYHPTHFDFIPDKEDVYYYNTNVWRLRESDGHCLYYDQRSLSGLVAFRKTLIKHYEKRLLRIVALEQEAEKNNGKVHSLKNPENLIPLKEGIHRLGFEPGTHNRKDKIDELTCSDFRSEHPNIDIRHENNVTESRWSIDKFRSKPTVWKEADEIPFWGKVRF